MRINQNINALKAWRSLDNVNTSMGKTLERLSTGLRINRAGDDAAGLSMSEKMRGQISGLNMAVKNAQDSISLIQTAEGALTEVHSILQRMRELAVQSANDTNVDVDRDAIQKEIDQLAAEVTRIAETTQFNAIDLLKGDFSGKFHIGANKGQNIELKIGNLRANALQIGADYTTSTINGHSVLKDESGNVKAVWYEGGYFDEDGNLILGANKQYTTIGNTLVYHGEEVAVWKEEQQITVEGYFDSGGNLITSINGPLKAAFEEGIHVLKDSDSNVVGTWYDKGYVDIDGNLIFPLSEKDLAELNEITINGVDYKPVNYTTDTYQVNKYQKEVYYSFYYEPGGIHYLSTNNQGSDNFAEWKDPGGEDLKGYYDNENNLIYARGQAFGTGEIYALVHEGVDSTPTKYAFYDGTDINNKGFYYSVGGAPVKVYSTEDPDSVENVLVLEDEDESKILGSWYEIQDGTSGFYNGGVDGDLIYASSDGELDEISFLVDSEGNPAAAWYDSGVTLPNGVLTPQAGYYDSEGYLIFPSNEPISDSGEELNGLVVDGTKMIVATFGDLDDEDIGYYSDDGTFLLNSTTPLFPGDTALDLKLGSWQVTESTQDAGYYYEDTLLWKTDSPFGEDDLGNWKSFEEVGYEIGYYDTEGNLIFASETAIENDRRITKGIDVSTQETADEAISKIDNAINIVSNERSNLGAMQNRLEHTIRNLQVSSENLAAAESRIRDVDMAKEMMEFTKQQILMQTSNAMLAQSNTIPQNVLRLLQ